MEASVVQRSQPCFPDQLRTLIEEYLRTVTLGSGPNAGLREAMEYSLLGDGKRIRPVLSLATAKAVGVDPESVLPLAAAIEMIHTYSLIHDDLPAMDDDDLRRGRPTCHKVYGEGVAILAGDGLYAEAFNHFLAHQTGEPSAILAAARELAAATGLHGMVGGQYLDITGSSTDNLQQIHELKTGRLISASVICVLHITGQTNEDTITGFTAFSQELGLLFQIIDDILDVTSSDAALGKPVGSDERNGKATYVTLYGLDEARRLATDHYERARAGLAMAVSPSEASDLIALTDFFHSRSS